MINLITGKDELVLEIGSGHNPHPRSDILVDRFLYNNQERQRRAVSIDRPIIIANGTNLPFADNYFDFVLCNQIIEHIEDLPAFIKEINRVAKRGLIIVPHALRERLFGWHYHRWFIDLNKDTLVFYPKSKTDQTQFAHFIHVLYANNLNFRYFIDKLENSLNVYYYWDSKIKYQIKKENTKLIKSYDNKVGLILQNITYKFSNICWQWLWEKQQKVINVANYYWQKSQRKNFRELNWTKLLKQLKCINCHKGKLVNKNEYWECDNCQGKFPSKNGIPIILNDADQLKGY